MKLIFRLLFTLLLIMSSGCATQHIKISRTEKDIEYEQPNYERWNHFFLLGIAQSVNINAEKICRNQGGIYVVQTQTSPLQAVIYFLTGGIYTPTTTNVYCVRK